MVKFLKVQLNKNKYDKIQIERKNKFIEKITRIICSKNFNDLNEIKKEVSNYNEEIFLSFSEEELNYFPYYRVGKVVLERNKFDNLILNLNKLLELLKNEEDITMIFILDKIYEEIEFNINLKREIKKNMDNILENTNKKIEENFKKSSQESTTILGIFTGIVLTFISGLVITNSIITNIKDTPIIKLLIITSIILTILVNMLYMLLSFTINKEKINKFKIDKFNKYMVFFLLFIIIVFIILVIMSYYSFGIAIYFLSI